MCCALSVVFLFIVYRSLFVGVLSMFGVCCWSCVVCCLVVVVTCVLSRVLFL